MGGLLELDTELLVDLNPKGKEDPVLQIVMLRFKKDVTEDSDTYKSFEAQIRRIDEVPGISAFLTISGHSKYIHEDLREDLQNGDASQGFTHMFLVAADSPQKLKELHANKVYTDWIALETPHFDTNSLWPPAVIFLA